MGAGEAEMSVVPAKRATSERVRKFMVKKVNLKTDV